MAQNQRPNPNPNPRQPPGGGGNNGGNGRPPRPGAAWIWDPVDKKWRRPAKPGQGNRWKWDDELGWYDTEGTPGPTPPTPNPNPNPNPNPTPTPGDPTGKPGNAWIWDGTKWVRPPKPTDGKPYTWDDDNGWVLDTGEVAARGEARAYLEELLNYYGLKELIPTLDGLITEWGGNTTVIMSRLRQSEPYQKRFKGLALRRNSGYSALNEAEYIGLEDQYKKTMSAYGLDPAYYSQDRLAELIGYDVSAAEVNDRIATGRQMLMSADQSVLKELREYYGLGQSDLLSYLLDPSIGQQVLDRRLAKAQIGGAAERYGFQVDTWDAERWVSSATGSTVSGFDLRTAGQMDAAMAQARRVADRETTLAAIDRERFTDLDAVDAVFGDEKKRLASEERAKRERARFAGSAGVAGTALTQSRNL